MHCSVVVVEAGLTAQLLLSLLQTYSFIREFTDKPMSTQEAIISNVAKAVVDVDAGTG